jgi:hypothetical protein
MGRYGNQLCPYFVGRIISENLKFKLFGPTETDREFMLHGINLNYNQPDYQSYELPVQQLGQHSLSDDLCHPSFDIFEVINDKTPRKIILDGYFQRHNFFTPFRDDIITWFDPTPYRTHENDVAVHIRIGDLLLGNNIKHLLPFEYYEEALNRINNIEKLTICTDSPEHKFVQYLLKKHNATLLQDNEKNTISFLAAHNNLILSQGTFSFWSGFLCNGKNIICPIPKTGWNSDIDDIDIDLLIQGPYYNYIKL